jgi:hypothetical protein
MRLLLFSLLLLSAQGYGQLPKVTLAELHMHGAVHTITYAGGERGYVFSIDSFDDGGRLLERRDLDETDAGGNSGQTYYYDAQKRPQYVVDRSGDGRSDTSFFRYDSYGRVSHMFYPGMHMTNQPAAVYDAKGNCIKKTQTVFVSDAKSMQQTLSLKYNAANQVSEVASDHNVPEMDRQNGEPLFYNEFEYFGVGADYGFTGRAVLTYDSQKRLVRQDIYGYKGTLKGTAICIYDDHGNIAKLTITDIKNKPIVLIYIYTYDSHGNWIKQVSDGATISRIITYY